MKNITLVVFYLLCFLPSLFQPTFGQNSQLNDLKNIRSASTPQTAIDIKSIVFDKETINQWCPLPDSVPNQFCPKNEANVSVTTVTDPPEDGLIYHYKVSGGKIIGQGAKIIWDFGNAKTGEYFINVVIENRKGIRGKSLTKSIKVLECPECDIFPAPCDCPILTIESSRLSAESNQTILLKAKIVGGSQKNVKYRWSVSGGNIITGQNKRQIKIRPNRQVIGNFISVKVEISGLCETCLTETDIEISVVR